jgi:dihydrolipoamide dehydrogenase
MKSKDVAVTGLTGGIEYLFKKNKVDYMKGWGKFNSANGVDVDMNTGGTESIKAKNIIIATGSEPNSLPAATGLSTDEKYVVSSTGALSLPKIPKRMIVIGGGVIGLEMGSVYQRLGTEVTVIHPSDRIANFLDKEIGTAFQRSLKKQGLNFKLNTKVLNGVNNGEKGCIVNIEGKDGK